MSFAKIWIHCVWTTSGRKPLLTDRIRRDVFEHIKENSRKKEIQIDCINGYTEHVHCLVSLKRDQNISDCIQLLKGESSFWINKNKICPVRFSWQDDYYAVSVSPSEIGPVRKYINNQDEHHRKASFDQEYRAFIAEYGFSKEQMG